MKEEPVEWWQQQKLMMTMMKQMKKGKVMMGKQRRGKQDVMAMWPRKTTKLMRMMKGEVER